MQVYHPGQCRASDRMEKRFFEEPGMHIDQTHFTQSVASWTYNGVVLHAHAGFLCKESEVLEWEKKE